MDIADFCKKIIDYLSLIFDISFSFNGISISIAGVFIFLILIALVIRTLRRLNDE